FSLFFFSSRRRHTRFSRDWSSDVCSSDLTFNLPLNRTSVAQHFVLKDETGQSIELNFSYLDNDKTLSAKPTYTLLNNSIYTIEIGALKAISGETFPGVSYTFRSEEHTSEL